ncbi:MAG TPA: lysylphosphatidylglycerol synthase transmembrane domain-containing protein [Candidatus Aquilonibacter sp.]|nr:lysylphosphatidylglycerol synthase transmembrane domain-containing protein [Candidatus Aquilonibacter sp.]
MRKVIVGLRGAFGPLAPIYLNLHRRGTFDGGERSFLLMTLFEPDRPSHSIVPRLLGYGLSIVFLVWVLHDFHVVRALKDMANADWKWVIVGMACDVTSYVAQAWRWKLLLTPFGRVRMTKSVRAIFSGLFANLVLPLRPGEFLRGYLLSGSENIKLGLTLGSVGVERLIDLVIATSALGVVSLLVDLPPRFRRAADILGIITLVIVTIIVALIFFLETKIGKNEGPPPDPTQAGLKGKIMAALFSLHAMGTAPSFYSAVLASLLVPGFQILAMWAIMTSYSLHLSFLVAVVVTVVINLGVSLPNAPANVGSYQFFCVLGLSIFDVDKTTATGFSIFVFIALTLPLLFLGIAALVRSGLSLRTMRERVAHPTEAPPPAAA